MRVFVLGATGRVGTEATRRAIEAGHDVVAFVRDPARMKNHAAHVAIGDITRPDTLLQALGTGIDAVINMVGTDPLKPSTLVTDTARTLVPAMQQIGVRRYVAISGTAQMPKTLFGAVSVAILRMTPVGNAIRDHQGAYEIITASSLDWTLAGCPWIKDGPTRGACEHAKFPGGMKSIVPADVAAFLVNVLDKPSYSRRIVGIWS